MRNIAETEVNEANTLTSEVQRAVTGSRTVRDMTPEKVSGLPCKRCGGRRCPGLDCRDDYGMCPFELVVLR